MTLSHESGSRDHMVILTVEQLRALVEIDDGAGVVVSQAGDVVNEITAWPCAAAPESERRLVLDHSGRVVDTCPRCGGRHTSRPGAAWCCVCGVPLADACQAACPECQDVEMRSAAVGAYYEPVQPVRPVSQRILDEMKANDGAS